MFDALLGSPTVGTRSESGATSSSSFTPPAGTGPGWGTTLANANYLAQNPPGYFPGPTYVPPSAATQSGVDFYMNQAFPAYQQVGNQIMNGPLLGSGGGGGGGYGGGGGGGGGGGPAYSARKDLAEGMSAYDRSGELMARADPYYQMGAEFGQQATPLYGQAAGYGQQAAGIRPGVAGQYGAAAMARNPAAAGYGRTGGMAMGAIAPQLGVLGSGTGNFNFLSNAADINANPHVQGMLDANRKQVGTALREDWLPAIEGSAKQANAMGSSRQGLAEGVAAGKAAEALAQANAQTQLGAYGQGLGAQQGALQQTGAMLANQIAPAQTSQYAAQNLAERANQLGLRAQTNAQGADQYSQALKDASAAAAQYGLGAQQLASSGAMAGQLGKDLLPVAQGLMGGEQAAMQATENRRASQDRKAASIAAAQAGASAARYGHSLDAQLGHMQLQAAMPALLSQGSLGALNMGQLIEGYQGNALQDSINRYNFQQYGPYQHTQMAQQLLNPYSQFGAQTSNQYGLQTGTQPNPNAMSPIQAGTGVATAVAALMAASDRRLKRDIRRIGSTEAGYPLYAFRYVWGEPGVGVMSDEIPEDWVIKHSSGFDMVDYSKVK